MIGRTLVSPFESVLYHRTHDTWQLVSGSGSISHGNMLFDVWGPDASHVFASEPGGARGDSTVANGRPLNPRLRPTS